jgi:hypothetical protein
MKLFVMVVLLALSVARPAFSDDKEKAMKELKRVAAMATDATGRVVVNQSIAEALNVKRPDLVMERRDTNLNYSGLFVAHKLTAGGMKWEEIAAGLKGGKDILQMADSKDANWKQIADDTKALNARIDANLYKRLVNRKAAEAQDQSDGYSAVLDGVASDNTVAQKDIDQAQDRYLAVKGRAEDASRRANRLDMATENAAHRDNARSGGPAAGSSGGTAPEAGGIR